MARRRAAKTYAIIDLQLEKYRSFCACNGVSEGEHLLVLLNQSMNQNMVKCELGVRYGKSNFALFLSFMVMEEQRDCIKSSCNTPLSVLK